MDEFLYGFTLPFRATADAILFLPTVAINATSESIHCLVDSDHEFDVMRDYETTRNCLGKVAAIGVSIAAIPATGGLALGLGASALTMNASNINQKCEKLMNGASGREKEQLRMGLACDALGMTGNVCSMANHGSIGGEIMRSIQLAAQTVNVPMSLVLKMTPEYIEKYRKMTPAEQALEAAAYGLSVYKLTELIQKLAEIFLLN